MDDNLEKANSEGSKMDSNYDLSNPLKITVIAFVLGFALEILFFNHVIGISFFIISLLCASGLLVSSFLEGQKLVWRNAIFVLPILFFSLMTSITSCAY